MTSFQALNIIGTRNSGRHQSHRKQEEVTALVSNDIEVIAEANEFSVCKMGTENFSVNILQDLLLDSQTGCERHISAFEGCEGTIVSNILLYLFGDLFIVSAH